MADSAERLTVEELEARFRAAKDVVERSHCQAIWLLAKGHSTADVAEIVALTPRWVNKLARRYEADGADALGDRRRGNRGARPLLDEADLEALRERLRTPPDDGGVWTGPKVARWIAVRLGLVQVHAPRGWEAAAPEDQAALKVPDRGSGNPTPLGGMGARRRGISCRDGIVQAWQLTDEVWAEYIKTQQPPAPDDDFRVT